MSQSLQFLRSTGVGSRPTSLLAGQVAINLTDKLLFIGTGGNDIVDQNGGTTSGVVGGGFFISDLDIVTATTSANAYTDTAIASLVDSAPGLLDTLNELAAALGDDPNFATTIANSVSTVQTNLDAEIVRATAAETQNSSDITAETARAQAAEGVNASAISAETSRAQAAEAVNAAAISAETTRATAAEAQNASDITAEETRALAAEGVNAAAISANATAISAETTRATAAEAQNASDISAEETRALAAEGVNATAIAAEETRALAAEAALSASISSNGTAVSAEEARALAAEAALDTRIDSLEADVDTEIVVAYDSDTAIFNNAYGSVAPIEDSHYREGWAYINSGDAIEWEIFDGTGAGTVADSVAYAVVTFDSVTSLPHFTIETVAQNDGNDYNAGSGARSRFSYEVPAGSYTPGKKYLLVFRGTSASTAEPAIHPELDRIVLQYNSYAQAGPSNTAETVKQFRLSTKSSYSSGAVDFVLDSFGHYNASGVDKETKTRFRKVSVVTYEAGFEQGTF